MLVLSRREGQTIHIDGHVVTILKLQSGIVRVGIDAPKSVPVNRGEVQARIDKEVAA